MKKTPAYFASPFPHYDTDPDDPTFSIFHYHWKYLITGASGLSWVWCRNRKDFLELINHWNKDERWKYWEY